MVVLVRQKLRLLVALTHVFERALWQLHLAALVDVEDVVALEPVEAHHLDCVLFFICGRGKRDEGREGRRERRE